MAAFHQRDGWHFERLPDGSVVISMVPVNAQTQSHVIPPAEWASIVAHVSAQGSTPEAYTAAEQLHVGVAGLPQ